MLMNWDIWIQVAIYLHSQIAKIRKILKWYPIMNSRKQRHCLFKPKNNDDILKFFEDIYKFICKVNKLQNICWSRAHTMIYLKLFVFLCNWSLHLIRKCKGTSQQTRKCTVIRLTNTHWWITFKGHFIKGTNTWKKHLLNSATAKTSQI